MPNVSTCCMAEAEAEAEPTYKARFGAEAEA